MPDLWDPDRDHVFSPPREQPNPVPSSQEDHTNEVRLKDDHGRLRLPAYILIALVIMLATVVLVTTGVLLAPG